METTPKKSSTEAAELSDDNGVGLMLIVLFVLAVVAALAI